MTLASLIQNILDPFGIAERRREAERQAYNRHLREIVDRRWDAAQKRAAEVEKQFADKMFAERNNPFG